MAQILPSLRDLANSGTLNPMLKHWAMAVNPSGIRWKALPIVADPTLGIRALQFLLDPGLGYWKSVGRRFAAYGDLQLSIGRRLLGLRFARCWRRRNGGRSGTASSCTDGSRL